MHPASRSVRPWACLVVAAHLACFSPAALAAVPPRGSEAPAISLQDLSGHPFSTAEVRGRPLVLIFGDLNHEGTRDTAAAVLTVLEDPRFTGTGILPVFLTAQSLPADDLAEQAAAGHFPPLVLRDQDRQAFGDYKIVAIPSVVVVDSKGIVLHAVAGRLPRFNELLTESLLVATGQEPPEQFERSLAGSDEPAPQSREQQRAERLVHLGEQLLPHHLDEMAEARFLEAISLVPGYAPARLALGELLRRQGKLDDAEAQFREILTSDPTSAEASLALARVRFDRGGPGIDDAEKLARGVLEHDDMNARAHYQLGRVLESRGDPGAAACYRRAAEILLGRTDRESR